MASPQSSTRVSALMRNIDGSEWLRDPGLDVVETVTARRPRRAVHAVRRSKSRPMDAGAAANRTRARRRQRNELSSTNFAISIRTTPAAGRCRSASAPIVARVRGRRCRSASICSSIKGKSRCSNARDRGAVDLRATFEEKQRKAANFDAYRAQLAEIERDFGAMLRQLPGKTEVPNLLVDISQTGLGAGLEEQLFQPDRRDPARTSTPSCRSRCGSPAAITSSAIL